MATLEGGAKNLLSYRGVRGDNGDNSAHLWTVSPWMVLYSVVHSKIDWNSCVTNDKIACERSSNPAYFHTCTHHANIYVKWGWLLDCLFQKAKQRWGLSVMLLWYPKYQIYQFSSVFGPALWPNSAGHTDRMYVYLSNLCSIILPKY